MKALVYGIYQLDVTHDGTVCVTLGCLSMVSFSHVTESCVSHTNFSLSIDESRVQHVHLFMQPTARWYHNLAMSNDPSATNTAVVAAEEANQAADHAKVASTIATELAEVAETDAEVAVAAEVEIKAGLKFKDEPATFPRDSRRPNGFWGTWGEKRKVNDGSKTIYT